jgi:primosomal protein N' (replication factor Y) (superfamily II helicase)
MIDALLLDLCAMSDLFGAEDVVAQPPPGGAWTYLRVAVERGLDQGGAGTGLTYRSASPVTVGRRVEVPLGRGNSPSAGIVIQAGGTELLEGFAPGKVKSILRDTGAGLPPRLVELARWMSGYYVCPLGMVLAAMLPAAVKKRTGLRLLVRLDRADEAVERALLESTKLPKQAAEAWEKVVELGRSALPLTPDDLAARITARTLAGINKLIKLGLLVESEVEDVRQFGGVETQMSVEQADPSGGAALLPSTVRPELTSTQARIVSGIAATLGGFGVHLIRGVTGSGKTEVYLRVLESVLARGQTALVLVPEISLTPQTAGRFVERFRAVGVGVLHSGLSASQRHREWSRAASGTAKVMVGARSAVFAPLDNLGLIVVDEEHASDYKQDQLPRYHGRDVAIKRAHMEGVPVILGTATPSLESWVNAKPLTPVRSSPASSDLPPPASKYALWEMTERVGGGKLPRVEIVDLAEERRIRQQTTGKRDAHLHLIGPTLERAIHETLNSGGQILLLLNRRGYASYIACPDSTCGWVMTCDDCDVKMVQHRVIAGKTPTKGVVRCHHCLAQKLLPEICPVCEKRLIALGLGTQGVEGELASKFPATLNPTTLVRVDGDTMASAKDYFATLSRFASGEIKVLVGTQMISKGLDFPNVRLVGVINADTALSLPDFRASERTFQLVSQVAGRAGRGTLSGRVIVQSFDPSAPALVHAAAHDFVTFAAEELLTRKESNLPPMSRLARIVLRDEELAKAEAAAARLKAALDEANAARGNKVRMIGPGPCPISRIAGHHRLELLLFSSSRSAIQDILADARAKGLCKSDAHTAIDIDPIALM